MTNKAKNLNFLFSSQCNWNCEYCYIKGCRQGKAPVKMPEEVADRRLEAFLATADKLKAGMRAANWEYKTVLTGGEPGILPVMLIQALIEKFNFIGEVRTNGTFADSDYGREMERRGEVASYLRHLRLSDLEHAQASYDRSVSCTPRANTRNVVVLRRTKIDQLERMLERTNIGQLHPSFFNYFTLDPWKPEFRTCIAEALRTPDYERVQRIVYEHKDRFTPGFRKDCDDMINMIPEHRKRVCYEKRLIFVDYTQASPIIRECCPHAPDIDLVAMPEREVVRYFTENPKDPMRCRECFTYQCLFQRI